MRKSWDSYLLGNKTNDPIFHKQWKSWIGKFGHLGIEVELPGCTYVSKFTYISKAKWNKLESYNNDYSSNFQWKLSNQFEVQKLFKLQDPYTFRLEYLKAHAQLMSINVPTTASTHVNLDDGVRTTIRNIPTHWDTIIPRVNRLEIKIGPSSLTSIDYFAKTILLLIFMRHMGKGFELAARWDHKYSMGSLISHTEYLNQVLDFYS